MSHSKDLEQLATTGARTARRCVARQSRRTRVLRAGREFPRRTRCAGGRHRAHSDGRLPPRGGRREAMAEAVGKLTGRPGIAFVTRGPGATHASIGVHTAFQDSTPMILFVGQCAREHLDREAFQEIDYRRMFGQMAKWVRADRRPAPHSRIPEPRVPSRRPAAPARSCSRCRKTCCPEACAPQRSCGREVARRSRRAARAAARRPAPHSRIPEPRVPRRDVRPPRPGRARAAGRRAVRSVRAAAGRAGRARRGRAVGRAARRAARAARARRAAVRDRRRQRLDTRRARTCAPSSSAGSVPLPGRSTTRTRTTRATSAGINPALAKRIRDADLLLVIGPRLGEATTGGYTLLDIPKTRQTLIHVHELAACMRPTCRSCRCPKSPRRSPRSSRPSTRGPAPLPTRRVSRMAPPMPGDVQLGDVMVQLRERLPHDAILNASRLCDLAASHFAYRHFSSRRPAARYGVPAALAAKLYLSRAVVALAGDGCFMMAGNEFRDRDAVRAEHRRDRRQQRAFRHDPHASGAQLPGRVHGTATNPDFAAYARAFGAHGETVERTADFARARARTDLRAARADRDPHPAGRQHAGRDTRTDPRRRARGG